MRFALVVLLFVVVTSCSRKQDARPLGILPADSMELIMFEIHLAEAGIQSTALEPVEVKKAVAQDRYANVLTKYGLNAAQLQANFEYYRNRPEKFREIYAGVISRLEAETAKAVNRPVVP